MSIRGRLAPVCQPLLLGCTGMNSSAKTREIPLFVRTAVIFALIIQQGAIVEMPLLNMFSSGEASRDINPLNTVGVAVTFVAMGLLFSFEARSIVKLAAANVIFIAFILLALVSAGWSIHPDLAIRRSAGYALSMLIAAYLSVRFSDIEAMKLLSASFAISAISSLLYALGSPDDGVMHIVTLEGSWRGVFPHKEVLGFVMAVACFVELYLIVRGSRPSLPRIFLLGLYFALILLSQSMTPLLLALCYLIAAGIYVLWTRSPLLSAIITTMFLMSVLLAALFLWVDPDFALGLLGKDSGLTGRTALWSVVTSLIRNRPFLGYGYRSMWGPTDTYRILADEQTGGWGVTSAHNSYLEVTLELGLIGMGVMVAILFVAFWRGIRCCFSGAVPLGWFSLVFFLMTVLGGMTLDLMGLEQNIFWLVFAVLFLSCGRHLVRKRASFVFARRSKLIFL
jgi:exopolysaccharide production protein ExoQ